MSFGRLLAALIAATAVAGCLAVVAFSVPYAFWALLAPTLGAAGATAAVAFGLAALVGAAALAAAFVLRPKPAPAVAAPSWDGALAFVRQRPVLSVVTAAGGLLVAALQPRLAAGIVFNLIRGRRTRPD